MAPRRGTEVEGAGLGFSAGCGGLNTLVSGHGGKLLVDVAGAVRELTGGDLATVERRDVPAIGSIQR